MKSPLSRRTSLALGIAIAISTVPYWEVLLGRRSAMYGDVNDAAIPGYLSVWRAITHGRAPWWTPDAFGGHSMVGAGQYAVFYPFNAIFGVLSPVTAYRWWLLAHLWCATAGAFAWSYYRFRSRPGAVVSGVAYAGCGFLVLHLVHDPFIIGATWLPYVFLGLDMVRQRWTTARAALVAVPVALICFGGQPQMLWITIVGAGVYLVAMFAFSAEPLVNFARAGVAFALGIGLAAVQLLPLWLFSKTSVRSTLTKQAAFETSAAPRHLLTLVYPYVFGGANAGSWFAAPWRGGDTQHEIGLFAGVTIIAAAVFAVVRGWKREPASRALLAMTIVSILVALAGTTPFGNLVYLVVPLAKSFRIWTRTILIANLAIAILAGGGIRELMRAPRRSVAPLCYATGAVALVALVIAHLHSLQKYAVGGSFGVIARGAPVLYILLMTAGVAVMTVHRRFGIVVLVAACTLEVVSFTYAAEWRTSGVPVHDARQFYSEKVPPVFGTVSDQPGGIDRWVSNSYGFRMVSEVKDVRGVNGYDPLLQKEWAETAGGFAYDGYPTRSDFWGPGWLADVLRVSTLVLDKKITPDSSWQRDTDVPGTGFVRWTRAPRLPEAYVAGRAVVQPITAIRALLSDPKAPLDNTAFVEHAPRNIEQLQDPRPAGVVRSANVLGSGKVVVDNERDGMLVLSHSWEDGWHATVDGHSAPVSRVNGLVIGVPVPAGHHVVRVGFRPPGLVAGAVLTLGSLLVLLLSAPVITWARRRWFLRPREVENSPDGGP